MRGGDPVPALKRQLGAQLAAFVEGWRAADVACLLGIDRARVSDLRRGALERFSLDMLVRLVTRAGRRVELRLNFDERDFRASSRRASASEIND